LKNAQPTELSDEELEAVAGGVTEIFLMELFGDNEKEGLLGI